MMKLTKEKCDKALEYARSHYYPPYAETMGLYEDFEVTEEYQILEQLIKEYFYNEPLKFEELKEGMWVWDNEDKLYVQIDEDFDEENGNIILRYYEDSYNSNCERTRFKENRFYRKQVEE